MSDIIHLLPDSIANQIAAGEVIQRPASVVKELVENAVDAGAGHIQVNIKDAGRTLVQVIDDGKVCLRLTPAWLLNGMQLRKFLLRTIFFSSYDGVSWRGACFDSGGFTSRASYSPERSRTGDASCIFGFRIRECRTGCLYRGEYFSVKNLFFNVPARRKFLKSNETEFRNIINEFERIALVNSQVALSLYHNDTEIFNLPESGLRQRIVNVYGKR